MLLAILMWVAFSVLVGKFWQQKGLKMEEGIFWSVILSPIIGFVIGVVKTPNLQNRERLEMQEGGKKKCPFCAELIKIEARVCRFCGRDLPEASAPAKTNSEPPHKTPPPSFESGVHSLLRQLNPNEFGEFCEVLATASQPVATLSTTADVIELIVDEDRNLAISTVPAVPGGAKPVVRITSTPRRAELLFGLAAQNGIGSVPQENSHSWVVRRADFERLAARFQV